jgi:site-specific recombinase XerD
MNDQSSDQLRFVPCMVIVNEAICEYVKRFRCKMPHTRAVQLGNLDRFRRWMDANKIDIQDPDVLWSFREHLGTCELAARSVNYLLTTARQFCDYCYSEKLISWDPRRIDGLFVRVPNHRFHGVVYSEKDVKKIKDAIGELPRYIRIRITAMLAVLFTTGIRISALAEMSLGDIRQAGRRSILMYRYKGTTSKMDSVTINAQALAILRRWLRVRCGAKVAGAPFWTDRHGERIATSTIQRSFRGILRTAGIYEQRKLLHTIRHTFATRAIQRGCSVRDVQRSLGHRDICSTEIYLHDLRSGKPELGSRYFRRVS